MFQVSTCNLTAQDTNGGYLDEVVFAGIILLCVTLPNWYSAFEAGEVNHTLKKWNLES